MQRILAIDFGTKRIGLALSDPLQMISKPLQTVQFQSNSDFIEILHEIIKKQDVGLIVLGLPMGLQGQDTKKTLEVKKFGKMLESRLPIPIIYWDESFSTAEANSELKKMGYDFMKAREFVDAVAASLILRSYLENRK
jgi:putative holliday junction resolvase